MKHLLYNPKQRTQIISETVDVLRKGGLVVFPSDTVYGLLVDAQNTLAVQKLTAFKNRPPGKPISVFVAGFPMLEKNVVVSDSQKAQLQMFLPGPFTVILESRHVVSRLLESERGSLGVRLTDFPDVTELVSRYGGPVTATSANISGRKPHYQVETFLKELSKQKIDLIDLVVDAGKLPRNKPSTIIDLTSSTIRLLRKGDIVFSSAQTFVSESPAQTKRIAEYIFDKNKMSLTKKPVVFILEGEVGAGKTIFTQGIGEKLGVKNIISPTYVVYYEYLVFKSEIKKLFHFDLYNIQDDEEFSHLGIENNLHEGNVFVFEWGEKTGPLLEKLKEKANIVFISFSYIDEKKRKITVKTNK